MNELTLEETLQIHQATLSKHGGSAGIRDEGALHSALSQPKMTMFGSDLYPDFATKGAALCFSLINNHPFVDGNKRTGFLALLVFLAKNGFVLAVTNAEAEMTILSVADGSLTRDGLVECIPAHLQPNI